MKLTRFVLTAAAAAGVAWWLKGRGPGGLFAAPPVRLALGAGLRGAVPAGWPVAETMWTPSDPTDPAESA